MTLYLEMELCHGTTEWDNLRERFLLTFSFDDGFERFDDGFESFDEVLQEIKVAIFITPKEPVERTQPDWST